ncbi:hypothetical protein [Chitinilyticum litopenaei]|uniref:hypothetical protein n=1 Tax=Chitinilyticum litopenaei TaxID=1121276 RepID=UPI000425F762|nr:hypothetical protein [Chitinilyticum litopenaei]
MQKQNISDSEVRKNSSLILFIAALFGLAAGVGAMFQLFASPNFNIGALLMGGFCFVLFFKCSKEIVRRVKTKKNPSTL